MKSPIVMVQIDAVIPAHSALISLVSVWRSRRGYREYPLTPRNYWRAVGMQLCLAGFVEPESSIVHLVVPPGKRLECPACRQVLKAPDDDFNPLDKKEGE